MEESVICLEDSTEVIDLSESIADDTPHQRDNHFQEFFVREKRTRSAKKANAAPAAVIDLSNDTELTPSGSSPSVNKRKKSIEMSCPVCFESFSKVQVKATTCGHVFCNDCIVATIKERKSCPKCRKKLAMKNLIPLYL